MVVNGLWEPQNNFPEGKKMKFPTKQQVFNYFKPFCCLSSAKEIQLMSIFLPSSSAHFFAGEFAVFVLLFFGVLSVPQQFLLSE